MQKSQLDSDRVYKRNHSIGSTNHDLSSKISIPALSGRTRASGQNHSEPTGPGCSCHSIFVNSLCIGIRDRITNWFKMDGFQFLDCFSLHVHVQKVNDLHERPSLRVTECLLNPHNNLQSFSGCDLDLDVTICIFWIDTDTVAILLCIRGYYWADFAPVSFLLYDLSKPEFVFVERFCILLAFELA